MTSLSRISRTAALLAFGFLLAARDAAAEETFVGSTADSRVVVPGDERGARQADFG